MTLLRQAQVRLGYQDPDSFTYISKFQAVRQFINSLKEVRIDTGNYEQRDVRFFYLHKIAKIRLHFISSIYRHKLLEKKYDDKQKSIIIGLETNDVSGGSHISELEHNAPFVSIFSVNRKSSQINSDVSVERVNAKLVQYFGETLPNSTQKSRSRVRFTFLVFNNMSDRKKVHSSRRALKN